MPIIKDGYFYCDCGCKLCRVTNELPKKTGVFIDCKKCKRRIEIKQPHNKKVPVPSASAYD